MPDLLRNKDEQIDVNYVAHLARLDLAADEIESFQAQLEEIVAYVHKISELDLSGIEPTSHAQPVQNVFRADEMRAGLDHDVAMNNAPAVTRGQFSVPKIVE